MCAITRELYNLVLELRPRSLNVCLEASRCHSPVSRQQAVACITPLLRIMAATASHVVNDGEVSVVNHTNILLG